MVDQFKVDAVAVRDDFAPLAIEAPDKESGVKPPHSR
jgi:hypothetical protein